MRQAFALTITVLCLAWGPFAVGQDQPSLGDAARQARQQKQQKGAQAKEGPNNKDGHASDGQAQDPTTPSKTQKVITNDEIPEHSPDTTSRKSNGESDGRIYSPASGAAKAPAEQWKSQILAQKNLVGSMQTEIDKLNDSIHFAPANCVANCVQWNQRQRDKQQEVERLQAQLEDQKKKLEDMQESARQQGYGSSVYDP